MKKAIMGLLSILLLLVSFWGINSRSHRSRERQTTDPTLWV
jgi:hypothetical protein